MNTQNQTHFGYEQVAEAERRDAWPESLIRLPSDLMNDLMSGGLHRLWKAFTAHRP